MCNQCINIGTKKREWWCILEPFTKLRLHLIVSQYGLQCNADDGSTMVNDPKAHLKLSTTPFTINLMET
jgi:hypothetical protein